MRVRWTARRSNQSIIKEISPGCSLEELMLKLKLQYFGHLMRRADSFEKTLMLGKIEGGKRREGHPLSGLQGVKPPVELERGLGIALQAIQERRPSARNDGGKIIQSAH